MTTPNEAASPDAPDELTPPSDAEEDADDSQEEEGRRADAGAPSKETAPQPVAPHDKVPGAQLKAPQQALKALPKAPPEAPKALEEAPPKAPKNSPDTPPSTTTNKPYGCMNCTDRFPTKAAARAHQKKHVEERDQLAEPEPDEEASSKVAEESRKRSDGRMPSEESVPKGVPSGEGLTIEQHTQAVDRVSEVVGQLQRWISEWKELPEDKRRDLTGEKTRIQKLSEFLAKPATTPGHANEAERILTLELTLPLRKAQGLDPAAAGPVYEPASHTRDAETVGKIGRARMTLAQLYGYWARLGAERQPQYGAIEDELGKASKALRDGRISPAKIEEVETTLTTTIKPQLEAILKGGVPEGSSMKGETVDLPMDDEGARHKRELARLQRDADLAEAKARAARATMEAERDRKLWEKIASADVPGIHPQAQLVAVTRPRVDPATGKHMTDEAGNQVMETVYQPAAQGSELVSFMNAIVPLLKPQNNGPSAKEMDLAMENRMKEAELRHQEQMHAMQENTRQMVEAIRQGQPQGPSPETVAMREEMRAMRDQNTAMMKQNFDAQLAAQNQNVARLEQKLERQAAFNPVKALLEQRQDMEALGMMPSATADAETQALKETTGVIRAGMTELRQRADATEKFLEPIVKGQAKLMEQQAGVRPKIASQSDEVKVMNYRKLLDNLDEELGAGEQQE